MLKLTSMNQEAIKFFIEDIEFKYSVTPGRAQDLLANALMSTEVRNAVFKQIAQSRTKGE